MEEVSTADRALVERTTQAMPAGPDGTEDFLALFAEDGVLVESMSGSSRTHEGKPAIRARYQEMMKQERPPDLRLTLDQVHQDGEQIVADWSCTSFVLPEPLRGRSRYTIHDGKIARLEIAFLNMHL